MNEIIKQWIEFINEWKNKPEKQCDNGFVKPQFYDFMEWLSEDLKNKK